MLSKTEFISGGGVWITNILQISTIQILINLEVSCYIHKTASAISTFFVHEISTLSGLPVYFVCDPHTLGQAYFHNFSLWSYYFSSSHLEARAKIWFIFSVLKSTSPAIRTIIELEVVIYWCSNNIVLVLLN